MDTATRIEQYSDAAGGPTADPHVAGFALKRFFADERGATAIEYALIATLLSVLIVTGATAIGGKLVTIFGSVAGGF